MAIAAFCVISALGLIAAAQAGCSIKPSKTEYQVGELKTAVVETNVKTSSQWKIIDTLTSRVRSIGNLIKKENPEAVDAAPSFMADFSSLDLDGSFKLRVDGCTTDSPVFTISNPLYAENSLLTSSKARSYEDDGISKGVGIALIVITVLLFVVTLGLGFYVLYLYCF